jgi:ATP-dependent helicase/nuclease subunit B
MHRFARAYPTILPDDIHGALVRIADGLFAELGSSPRVEGFWRPHFQRFARWFALTEPARRAAIAATHTELNGALDLAVGGGFHLTARADRIDVNADGSVTIYDYKTGTLPVAKHVEELSAAQLPLEAAIAKRGGFAELGARHVHELRYIQASGRHDGGEERLASPADPETLADKVLEDLGKLVARFDDPETPYEVKRRQGAAFANAYRYDEYEHLARLREWLTQDTEEEPR